MGMTGKVQTDTYEMEYYRFGNGGRNLVILPGVSMKSTVALGSALETVFSRFTAIFTVYLFDRKLNMTEGYSVKDMADDTADAMRHLGIKDAYIYAVSQGAMIAMCTAIYHKDLVHLLYLSSTLARPNAKSKAVFAEWGRLTDSDDYKTLYESIHRYVYSPEYLEKYADAFTALIKSGSKEEVPRFGILAKACYDFDIYDSLSEIKCPVFITGSNADRIVGPEGPREIADLLGCPCYLYDGYSHAVYDEAPDYFDRMYSTIYQL